MTLSFNLLIIIKYSLLFVSKKIKYSHFLIYNIVSKKLWKIMRELTLSIIFFIPFVCKLSKFNQNLNGTGQFSKGYAKGSYLFIFLE